MNNPNCKLKFIEQLKSLPVYQPGKPIDEVARELGLDPHSIVKLASNENPLGPSPLAIAAVKKMLNQTHLYPDGNSFYLKQKLSEKFQIPQNQISLGNGSNELLELAGHILLDPQSEAVMSEYCFAVYPIVTSLFGAKLVVVKSKNYGHDLKAMASAVTKKTKIVFVANPNNPTGTMVSADELLKFIHSVPEDVLIAVDEAYIDFLDQPPDLLTLVRQKTKPNLVLFRTFSKIYGLAGFRVGYAFGHPEVIEAFEKAREPFNVNSLAQTAAIAALDDTKHVNKTKEINKSGLAYLMKEFDRLGLEYIPSNVNFILVKVGNGDLVFKELQKLGVIIRPMGGYKLPEWIRITVGLPQENQKCINSLETVLSKL
jgi:histidinol-phosphate aminotransferase